MATRVLLLALVWVAWGGSVWEGHWESGDSSMYIHGCVDSRNEWRALIQNSQGYSIQFLHSTLSSPTSTTGSTHPPNTPIRLSLDVREEPLIVPVGGEIEFVVREGEVGPLNVTVVNVEGTVMAEWLGVTPTNVAKWSTDASIIEKFGLNSDWNVYVLWGTETMNLKFYNFGDSFSVTMDRLSYYIAFLSDYGEKNLIFYPISRTVSTVCGDNSKMWMGAWKLDPPPPISNFGSSWFVCPSSFPESVLISSFSTITDVAYSYPTYFTEEVALSFNSIIGTFASAQYLDDKGEFYFEIFPNNSLSFSGYVVYYSTYYYVTGTLIDRSTFNYLCSPFDHFGGLWIEEKYSSYMNICVDNNQVYGSYLGGAITLTGQINYLYTQFAIQLVAYNTRLNETNSYNLLILDQDTQQQPLYLTGSTILTLFATPQYRSISNCSTIPSTWGIYYDDLFSSELYLCTGNNNTVYGRMNNSTYTFNGIVTDLNVISGSLNGIGLNFIWTINYNEIIAEYTDKNGISIGATMSKISSNVTLSQCQGTVLITAYIGTWFIEDSSLAYLCLISNSQVDGKMGDYFLSGGYTSPGILTGTYTKSDGTSGTWKASSDTQENKIQLIIGTTILNGIRYSRNSDTMSCGSWRSFWKMTFGFDAHFLLGGCFKVCFIDQYEFNIIFFNSEIHGNGTMNPVTGTLVGQYVNGWNFSISIIDPVVMVVNMTLNEETSMVYIPCPKYYSHYLATPTDYPSCLPRRFSPSVQLGSQSGIQNHNIDSSIIRKGGVDITVDGTIAIVASGNSTFIVVAKGGGNWGNEFVLPPVINNIEYDMDYENYGGTPVAITNTHAFVIMEYSVYVFKFVSGTWEWIGYLDPPINLSRPFYVMKSFSEGYCVLEVTWYLSSQVYLSLYNISYGQVDLAPFYTFTWDGMVLSAAIHPSWFVFTGFDYASYEVRVNYCSLSLQGIDTCSYFKLTTISKTTHDLMAELGMGYSIAVNSNYLFVGYPSSEDNNGTIYVFKYNGIWRLSQILQPPDSGFRQSFGREIYAKENHVAVLKAHDNSLKLFSMALYIYTLSSQKWLPNFKMVSEDWPSIHTPSFKKRQHFYPSAVEGDLEPTVLWQMSNNGTLFITGENLDLFTQAWYSCAPGFWGLDCSSVCPCQLNSTCINNIYDYSCSCLSNTWGFNCDKKCKDCHGAPCDDGATGTGNCICNSSQYGQECLPCLCVHGYCSSGFNGTGCICYDGYSGMYCDNSHISTSTVIAVSVVLPCVVIIIIVILAYFGWKSAVMDISDLPEDLRWYFDRIRVKSEAGWTEYEKGLKMKNVASDKKYTKKLSSLMKELDGGSLQWKKAHAIFNLTLQNNFLGYRRVTLSRHKSSPGLFKKDYHHNEMRDWVMVQFNNHVKNFGWNFSLELPILPVIHGTNASTAKSICATGFAALSSLDAGFYGKGIYVTSSCLYALPYYASKTQPAILVCLATPGNVSPIIEDINGSDSWLGRAVPNGFQSHFVITAKNGKVIKNREEKFYNELVLPTEGQLLPIFMIRLAKAPLQELLKQFNRKVSTNQ